MESTLATTGHSVKEVDVLFIANPYDPQGSAKRVKTQSGISIREFLREHYGPDFEEFPVATICQLNARPMLRAKWDTLLQPGDHLMFVTVPQGTVAIILAVVSIAIAIGIYFLLGDPQIPGETQSGDSVYTLRGQNNRFRPGEPVEVVYGKCRIWPTFLSRPYSRYVGNQQYQYSLFCLGQGDFTIHNTYIDDTPTSRFDEVEIELCPPGTPVTLVEAAVYPSLEIQNIELLAPNEPEYDSWSGPFILNDFDKPIRRIEVDVNFPSGLYRLNDEGKILSETVQLMFEYQLIDEAGAPLGSWTTLANPTIYRASNTPQRITYNQPGLTAGRYQVRGRRLTNKPEDSRRITQVRWESAKGYRRLNSASFGDVYVIAMKARATNQLNDQSSKSFNVRATRKLPVWNGSTWSAPTATRNPVWAFCDIMRATYGAKLDDTYLDMDKLLSLAGTFNTRNDWFDWIFDSSITVWEAAKTALRVGRATPIPQGALITAVRDEATSFVTAVFNQHNILQGSLSKQLSMFQFQPYDGVLVEYIDEDTWKPMTVEAVLPGRAGDNLERIKIPGCTNRNRALREGLYMQSRREYQRKTVEFRTGMEGYIPVYMDVIAVTHDTLRVGQGGMILDYDAGTKVMTLSEQVNFGPSNIQHYIALRGTDGGLLGTPIAVTAVDGEPNKVELAEDPEEALDFSSDQVPPLYAFGISDLWSFKGKVIAVKPVDWNTVQITAVNYVDDSYTHDSEEAVPVDEIEVITDPDDPEIGWVEVVGTLDNASLVSISWEPVAGAASYMIQFRYVEDGADEVWLDVDTVTTGPYQLPVEIGTIIARVAPFSSSGNPIWTESDPFVVGSTVTPPIAPGSSPATTFAPLQAELYWTAVGTASGYIVRVYLPDTTLIHEENVGVATSYNYTRASFEADTAPEDNTAELDFRVMAFNAGGESDPLEYTLTNVAPSAPTSLASGSPTGSDYPVTWSGGTEDDFDKFRLYASTTMGFTPGPGNLVSEPTSGSGTVNATVTTYWRVGSVDVWGNETISAEQVITI